MRNAEIERNRLASEQLEKENKVRKEMEKNDAEMARILGEELE